MSNNNQPGSFFDGRFLITMVLVLAVWLGWQSYMAKKYPNSFGKKKSQEIEVVAKDETVSNVNMSAEEKTADTLEVVNKIDKPDEALIEFEDDNWKFKLSSVGMAVRDVELKKYTDRHGNLISFAKKNEEGLFATVISGRRDPIAFSIKKTSDTEFMGEASVDGMKITKVIHVDSPKYSLATVVRVENVSSTFTGLVTTTHEQIHAAGKSSFLMPRFEHQEFFAYHDGSSSRLAVAPDKGESNNYVQTKIAAFGSQYFATAIVDRSPVIPEFKATSVPDSSTEDKEKMKGMAIGQLTYPLLNKADTFAVEYTGFAGPKSLDLLKSIDADLTHVVDLGFFTTIAKGILWLMKVIHSGIGNWGGAIIFLTIIVRIIVLPFNMLGYKQMRAMTKIQPQIKTLRERYKNDQQTLNQEMMKLMKEAKANPLGGCLPMFVQIPVFFALYRVIGQSIDLYQAPFVLWIQDLSLKDPYYTLPALMGITMYLQQRITPSTLDPAQQKIMNFLPLMFTFFMISLPSGLTLYITVSSVFGVLQQLYFMKTNSDSEKVTVIEKRRPHVGIFR